MIPIVPVDDRLGMRFNRRRQSQDRLLREYLLKHCRKKPLLMNAYSGKQFGAVPGIQVREDFLSAAGPGDYCFVEDQALLPYSDQIEALILCRWNRAYPGDFFLDLPIHSWKQVSVEEIPGSSHEKITIEVLKP